MLHHLLTGAFLLVMSIAIAGCGGSAAPGETIPPPHFASYPTAPPVPAAAPAATPVPQSAPAGVMPQREVVLAVSRKLADGEKDPYFTHSSLMVWESLVALDGQLNPAPQLTESWDLSSDAMTWTFNLRRGISFTDGVPFDADAAVANIERFMRISPRPSPFFTFTIAASYGDLAGISKVDDDTVSFQLNTPNPSTVFTMSNFFSAMFSPAFFAENGDFTGIPAATGPFRLTDWKKDQFFLLERNEDYWGKKPLVKRIRVRVIPDSGARVSALLSGEVDGVVELGALAPAEAKSLEGRRGIVVGADPVSITLYLAFGTDRPPFDNVELRRAVALAVDREAIVHKLALGYGTPGKSLLSPFAPQWLSPAGEPGYDPVQARALAKSALDGKRVGATLIFPSATGQARPWKAIGELLKSELGKLGIDLELVSLERAAERDRQESGDWNLRFAQQGWANGDPDWIMSRFLSSDGDYNIARKGGYNNPEADRLVAAGRAERDPKKRFEIYGRLQEIAVQEVPVTPLYHVHLSYAYRDTITGLRHRVNYQPSLDEIRLVK